MAHIIWHVLDIPYRLITRLRHFYQSLRLLLLSLCYNEFTSWNTVLDTAFEPLFWIVDHSTRFMGPIMVTLVVLLTTMVVMVTYVCIFPHIYYQTDVFWSVFHLVFAHWLLINIVFNYVMAVFTNPGHPPQNQNVSAVVSICKKCISPKPPRTHHCSICGVCVLKMDHHCPWINNCVGFYNHRYFFQFVCFMWLGTMYVSFAGYDVFKQHFFGNRELIVPAFFFPINMVYHAWKEKQEQSEVTLNQESMKNEDDVIKPTLEEHIFHNAVIFQFLLCAGVAVALGALGTWHARLISLGQTSIEQHINKKEAARLKKKNLVFRNPYHFGFWRNWKIFFGLGRKNRSFFRHVLLPSRHDPAGDGLSWETATFKLDRAHFLDLL